MNSPAKDRTVKLKLTHGGTALMVAPPSATVGEKSLVYAVNNVPPRVTDHKVLELVVASCLIDPNAEYPTWTYEWETFEILEDYDPLDEINELDDD